MKESSFLTLDIPGNDTENIDYTTFRIHARRYIQPAIVHSWKTAQDGMLQQLRQQQNIVLGGDMRADSPGTKCWKTVSVYILLWKQNIQSNNNK